MNINLFYLAMYGQYIQLLLNHAYWASSSVIEQAASFLFVVAEEMHPFRPREALKSLNVVLREAEHRSTSHRLK